MYVVDQGVSYTRHCSNVGSDMLPFTIVNVTTLHDILQGCLCSL